MDLIEAKVRCLELGVAVSKATNNYDPASIVDIATKLYDFVQPSEAVPTAKDKGTRQRNKSGEADPLS